MITPLQFLGLFYLGMVVVSLIVVLVSMIKSKETIYNNPFLGFFNGCALLVASLGWFVILPVLMFVSVQEVFDDAD